MVARGESMFGSYDSYSYRLWSLANVWNTCQPPSLTNGVIKEEEMSPMAAVAAAAAAAAAEYFIKCPQCQQGCQSFQALKEHAEAVHGGEGAVAPASGAGLNAAEMGGARTPPALAGPGGPFGCAHCPTSFAAKEQLEKHEMLHSPNAQVSCKICNKTFANVYRLQRHMISHDESAVLRKFKCTECDKAFKFKHHLKEHIRIHSGEKPFECGNCGKRFSHSGSYSSHMTSKKCLVMNLKLGRTRAPTNNTLLDKTSQQNVRIPKRTNVSPINNNIPTSPNHNAYLPILPKYSEAAAAFFQSSLAGNTSLSPFYLTPPSLLNTGHSIDPYRTIPSLGHILEQLQQQNANHIRPPIMDTDTPARYVTPHSYDTASVKSENNENAPSNAASECGDLIMDEDADPEPETAKTETTENKENTNNGDLEAVKRILETVNATVTKELLQANMQKVTSDSSSDSHSVASSHSPRAISCSNCKKSFTSPNQLEEHECEDLRSEGLAAKLEDAVTTKSDDAHNGSISSNDDQEYDRLHYNANDEVDSESFATTDHVSEDGRKVRVRSLISDEQLKILKDHYKLNARPKREDLEKIAATIGFPVRVVQVWFQNTRARDRREGRLFQVPYNPATYPPTTSVVPMKMPPQDSSPPPVSEYISEQPLDLSIRKGSMSNESSPVSSPRRPPSVNHQESNDEVVNLSRKSSSPGPYVPHHYQGSNSSEPRQSPSPSGLDFNSSRLAQILAQPSHVSIPGMGLVSLLDQPSLSHLIKVKLSSMSPQGQGEKRKCDAMDEDPNGAKRRFMLKNLGVPVYDGQEPEVEGQFSCDQCDKAFSKQSSLARHKYEHSGQRPHKCDECTKAFKHKHHLTEHKRLHSGEKPFQCSKCLKRFSHSGSYSQHMNHRYSYCKPYRE